MNDAILTLNAGSSSLKFALFEIATGAPRPLAHGQVEGLGVVPHFIARGADGAVLTEQRLGEGTGLGHEDFLAPLFAWAENHLEGDQLVAVGHRIVHGGAYFRRPTVIDFDVLEQLKTLCPLAPLHQPHNLAAVRAAQAARPGLPQVACFDTAFHHTQSETATRFALPEAWRARGVRRYGFHGLSYEYVSRRLRQLDPELAAGKVVIAHLGSGASLCALDAGRSVDTTMGFTALDGLVMGTRCGALDPGVVLYLQQQAGLSVEAVSDLLYRQSGLLGVSGLSGDMRTLLASDNPHAATAIDLFVFRIAREACALTAALEGLDGLVFTAGIGENAPAIRAKVARRLAWMGLVLDDAANAAGAGCISAPQSRIKAWVIPTDEERMIAEHTMAVLAAQPGG